MANVCHCERLNGKTAGKITSKTLVGAPATAGAKTF
jgi:hypothetical protein